MKIRKVKLRRIKKGYGRRGGMGSELSLWFGAGIVVGGVGLLIYRLTQGRWPWAPATAQTLTLPTGELVSLNTAQNPGGLVVTQDSSGNLNVQAVPLG